MEGVGECRGGSGGSLQHESSGKGGRGENGAVNRGDGKGAGGQQR